MNARRNRQRGKENERAVAKYTGGERKGIMGKEDVSCGPWSMETKVLASFVGNKYLEQAERHAPEGKTPVAIIRKKNQRIDQAIVMMRLKDWWDWHGEMSIE